MGLDSSAASHHRESTVRLVGKKVTCAFVEPRPAMPACDYVGAGGLLLRDGL
jgi:hypothetical protein